MSKGNLHNVLVNEKLTWNQKIKIALDIARGLNYLHTLNPPIIHRDLKSLNILISKKYTAKISDLGFSRTKEKTKRSMTNFVGSIQWMAPEVMSDEQYDLSADIYSFSIILWEIYSQKFPYENEILESLFYKVKNEDYRPKSLEIVNESIKKEQELYLSIMKDCWNKDPKSRLNTSQIITKLEKCLIKDEIKNY